jgi:hypothetical protein
VMTQEERHERVAKMVQEIYLKVSASTETALSQHPDGQMISMLFGFTSSEAKLDMLTHHIAQSLAGLGMISLMFKLFEELGGDTEELAKICVEAVKPTPPHYRKDVH